MWTYLLPIIIKKPGICEIGKNRKVLQVIADFRYPTQWDPMIYICDVHIASGVLLNIGIYIFTFTGWILMSYL